MTRVERAVNAAQEPDHGLTPPRTRGECIDGPRPCPWVSCKYHLFLDVQPNGSIKLNFPDLEVADLEHSCTLDLAAKGGMPLEQVAEVINLTKERVRQIEVRAFRRILNRADLRGILDYVTPDPETSRAEPEE